MFRICLEYGYDSGQSICSLRYKYECSTELVYDCEPSSWTRPEGDCGYKFKEVCRNVIAPCP
jgi:hypothetical protein